MLMSWIGTTSKSLLFNLVICTFCQADVLNVDGGEYSTVAKISSNHVTGVLDFNRPLKVQADNERTAQVTPSSIDTALVHNATSLPHGTAEIEGLIYEIAFYYAQHPGIRVSGLSTMEWVALFRANIAIESNFLQSARSHVGAIGLGQLMPETARTLGVNPYDARENLHGSARYLLTQLQDFRSKELALAAYNAGPEAVSRYGGIPPYRETQGHVRKVLEIYYAIL